VRCKVLRSGSSGNCTLIEHEHDKILIDAGFSQRRILELLDESGVAISSITGIIVTHCHADHLNYSTLQVCRKSNVPLWINEENVSALQTLYKQSLLDECPIQLFSSKLFSIGSFEIQPFDLSHDAAGKTCGFVIKNQLVEKASLTYAADLGVFPDGLVPFFKDSKVIILEANHDIDLLWKNPSRPYIHKKRVAGDYGHLSNAQSADALIRICKSSSAIPETIVLCHLSEDHNSPELAISTIKGLLEQAGISIELLVAQRKSATPYIEI
jgi:phosphoribosyl 1,2-cyclic phosphodiesterase